MTLFELIYLPGELQKIAFPLLYWISSMNTQLVSRSHFTTVEPSRRSALNPRGGLFKNDSSSITSITNREMVFLFLTSWGQNEWSSSSWVAVCFGLFGGRGAGLWICGHQKSL